MKPHDMRELFEDALAESQPTAGADTDHIVTAGRRRLWRRRTAQAGSGTLAAVAVAAALALAPSVLPSPDGVKPAASASGTEAGDEDVDDVACPPPAEEPTDERVRVAAMYDAALADYVSSIGGSLVERCAEDQTYEGFHYDSDFGGYRYAETAYFPDTGEHLTLNVDVHAPFDGDVEARLEELSYCEALELTCTEHEVDKGTLLLVKEYYSVSFDTESATASDSEPMMATSALLALHDGTIVHARMARSDALGGPGTFSTMPEELGGLAAAIPVGEDPS